MSPPSRDGDLLSILVLSSYLPGVGGGELQTALQIRTLVRRGHRVRVIDLGTHPDAPRREIRDGAEIYRVRESALPGLAGIGVQAKLGLLLGRLLRDTDIIHFNHIGTQLLVTRLWAWISGTPMVVVVWGSSRPGIGPFRGGLKWRLARQAGRGAEALVALGRETRVNLIRQGFPESRITFIPNGLDLERFRPARDPADLPGDAPSGSPRVLAVGRLVPAKGFDLLIQAWGRIRQRHPAAVLAIVGEGPERPGLERELARMGPEMGIHLLGLHRDVERWFRWGDLFVSSSRTEGMSNALLEALGSGLPVLATRVGGAEDVIADGVNGRLVAPGSAGEIESTLLDLLDRPDQLREMGRAARSRAELELGIEAVMDRYEALYRRTLDVSGSGRS